MTYAGFPLLHMQGFPRKWWIPPYVISVFLQWRKVFPLSNDLNTRRELGALTMV